MEARFIDCHAICSSWRGVFRQGSSKKTELGYVSSRVYEISSFHTFISNITQPSSNRSQATPFDIETVYWDCELWKTLVLGRIWVKGLHWCGFNLLDVWVKEWSMEDSRVWDLLGYRNNYMAIAWDGLNGYYVRQNPYSSRYPRSPFLLRPRVQSVARMVIFLMPHAYNASHDVRIFRTPSWSPNNH